MANNFKYYINGTLLSDEPKGWQDSAKKLKRSEEHNNIFIEYVTDLIFHGDGYSIISSLINEQGYCADANLKIDYRCSEFEDFENYFTGKLKLIDAEFDDERCEVMCHAEDESLFGLIKPRFSHKVRLASSKTVTGVDDITISQRTIAIPDTDTGITVSRSGYYVVDILDFLVRYISDNQISVVSDFFSTSTSTRITQTITFLSPLNATGIFLGNLRWTDYFGVDHNSGILTTASSNPSVNLDTICKFFVGNTSLGGGNHNEFNSFKDYQYFAKATHNGSNQITLVSDLPMKLRMPNLCTVSDASPELPDNGKKYLSYFSGLMLRGQTDAPIVSFDDIYNDLENLFNLSFSIERISGNLIMRIEPLIYFIDSSHVFNIDNVINMTHKKSEQMVKAQLSMGDNDFIHKAYASYAYSNSTWVVNRSCYGGDADWSTKAIVDADSIANYMTGVSSATNTENDKRGFLLECARLQNGSIRGIPYENNIYALGVQYTYYSLNAQLTNYWVLSNNLLRIAGNPKYYNRVITNSKDIYLDNEYTFDAPISFSQQRDIFNYKNKFVNFTTDNGINYKKGYVLDVTFNLIKGTANFILLSN